VFRGFKGRRLFKLRKIESDKSVTLATPLPGLLMMMARYPDDKDFVKKCLDILIVRTSEPKAAAGA
jgi:hypothetical protein